MKNKDSKLMQQVIALPGAIICFFIYVCAVYYRHKRHLETIQYSDTLANVLIGAIMPAAIIFWVLALCLTLTIKFIL